MATGDRTDPYLSFNFQVEIESLTVGGFNEVSGLQAEIEVQEYREGGLNQYVHKLPGSARYPSNLTLKHGLADSETLWHWVHDAMQGNVKRCNVSIRLMNLAGEEVHRWQFAKAYPVRWSGPDLRAGTAEVAIETLELAHQGLINA